MKISYRPKKEEQTILSLRGVPGSVYQTNQFDLDRYIKPFTSNADGLRPQQIKKNTQLENFARTLDNPLDSVYSFCISSEPNDARAKLAAAMIMLKAYRSRGPNDLLVWHTLNGSYRDKLRDEYNASIKFLVLSNCPTDMTMVKKEKLRDLIEVYNDIPKVVVTSGCDPIKFFNQLYLPVQRALFIRSERFQSIGYY